MTETVIQRDEVEKDGLIADKYKNVRVEHYSSGEISHKLLRHQQRPIYGPIYKGAYTLRRWF